MWCIPFTNLKNHGSGRYRVLDRGVQELQSGPAREVWVYFGCFEMNFGSIYSYRSLG